MLAGWAELQAEKLSPFQCTPDVAISATSWTFLCDDLPEDHLQLAMPQEMGVNHMPALSSAFSACCPTDAGTYQTRVACSMLEVMIILHPPSKMHHVHVQRERELMAGFLVLLSLSAAQQSEMASVPQSCRCRQPLYRHSQPCILAPCN